MVLTESVNNTNTVGASLLAKAECQPIYMSTDTTPSRASSLPQVKRRNLELSGQTRPLIDRALGIQLGRHLGAADQVHAAAGGLQRSAFQTNEIIQ